MRSPPSERKETPWQSTPGPTIARLMLFLPVVVLKMNKAEGKVVGAACQGEILSWAPCQFGRART